MHVTHYARRSLVAAALALAATACSKDNGPSEFDPQGTSADMAAAQGAFVSGPTASFTAVGTQISALLGGSPLVASSAALALTKPSQISARYARQMAALVPGGRPAIQASSAAVPASYLGVTFVWDENTHGYVESDLAGAPATGVRFLLYAVDPVQLQVVEPAVEVGYVDISDQSTSSSTGFRVKVVEANVTYLDYTVAASGSISGGLVTVSGFASNGSTLANFTLKNTISENAGGLVLSLDYDLNVPSRGVSLNWTATFANISDTEVVVTLDLGDQRPERPGAAGGNLRRQRRELLGQGQRRPVRHGHAGRCRADDRRRGRGAADAGRGGDAARHHELLRVVSGGLQRAGAAAGRLSRRRHRSNDEGPAISAGPSCVIPPASPFRRRARGPGPRSSGPPPPRRSW